MKRFLLLFLLLVPLAMANTGQMTLLTVTEGGDEGGTANVVLTVRPGSGSIFIDSFPLSRLDTQSSTRYANKIACDFLQIDCDVYDFFYTIRSGSQVVGGPSAGAAMAVLAVAVLDNQEIKESIAMTGTINSGGIIGPVGGLNAKIDGAHAAGIEKVILPAFSKYNETNVTTEVEVYRVRILEEALFIVTGKDYSKSLPPVQEPKEYTKRMHEVAMQICERNAYLRSYVEDYDLNYTDINNYTKRIVLTPDDRMYTLASLCFSSNIELNRLIVAEMSEEAQDELHVDLIEQLLKLDSEIRDREITTISDLEVFNIVGERMLEAGELLHNISSSNELAYAQERLISAQSWTRFFGMPGRKVSLDDAYLEKACAEKIAEAEERISYLQLFFPELTESSGDALDLAKKYGETEPILCIFSASQAKARANEIISVMFLDEEEIPYLLEEKLLADDMVLRKEVQKGHFPLMGYSYARYAEDLAVAQPYSALLFAEYALELSSLDMYFPKQSAGIPQKMNDEVWLFLLGALFGAAVVILLKKGP